MRAITILTSIACVLALSTAQAAHCITWSTSVSNEDALIVDLGEEYGWAGRYLVNDLCNVPYASTEPSVIRVWFGHEFARVPVPFTAGVDCLFSVWVYYETNGIPGLQRGDEVVDDTCHGMIDADTFLW